MKHQQSPFVRNMLAIAFVFILLAGSVHAAYAESGVNTWKDVTETFEAGGTCADPDGLYQITVLSSGVSRNWSDEDSLKFTWAEHGTYILEPVDADSTVTYSGQYTVEARNHWSGDGTFLYAINTTMTALGSDGSRATIHTTFHLVITQNGIERVVDHMKMICH